MNYKVVADDVLPHSMLLWRVKQAALLHCSSSLINISLEMEFRQSDAIAPAPTASRAEKTKTAQELAP